MSLQTRLGELITALGADVKELRGSWIASSVSLTFSSAAAPTFVATTGSDLSGLIPVGARIKLTQTTVKYFIVTAIDATTITLYGGTDYTLANAAISLVSYSIAKAPLGFPLQAEKWTVSVSDANVRSQGSPTANTWYKPTNGTVLSLPIGSWRVSWRASMSSSANANMSITLSTTTNTETDTNLTFYGGYNTGVAAGSMIETFSHVTVTVATTYNLLIRTSTAGILTISYSTTLVRAVCAYL